MIAFILSPLGRWAAVGVLLASVASWGAFERLLRQSAQADARAARSALEACQANARNMEIRRHEEDRASRDPDPVGRLRERWGSP